MYPTIQGDSTVLKTPISDIRKRYILRLIGRCIILLLAVFLYFTDFPRQDILEGFSFFHKFSWLHVLWGIWMLDMLFQLIPVKHIALGSHKVFKLRFRPVLERINLEGLKHYILTTTRSAYKVMILWIALISALGVLWHLHILKDAQSRTAALSRPPQARASAWEGALSRRRTAARGGCTMPSPRMTRG